MFDTLLNQIKAIELPVEVLAKIEQIIETARTRGEFEDAELETIQKMLEACAQADEINADALEQLGNLMGKLVDGSMDILAENLKTSDNIATK